MKPFYNATAIFYFSDSHASKAERDAFLASQGLASSGYPLSEVPSLNRALLLMFNMNSKYNFKHESHTFIIATGFGPCSYRLSFTNGGIAIIGQYHSSLDPKLQVGCEIKSLQKSF